MEETVFISVSEIQKKYLPVSKKKIRKILNSKLNVKRNGNRILVNREQFLAYINNPDNVNLA